MLSVEGLGPKTIKLLYEELGIENLDDLERHAKRHHIRRIKGMGDKKEKKILENIDFARKNSGRKLLGHILPLSEDLRSKIAELDAAEQVKIAGSIRRRKETVGDIDILVITKKPQEIMDFFTEMDSVDEIIVKGPSKSTVILKQGLDCDLRVFEDDIFGAALLYFTGSKELNVDLRKIAISQEMKLSEYGLFKGKDKVAGKTEKEIFNRLGLDYIPPELRESRGEVDAAREGKLPKLIDYNDICGDLQVHSDWSDGENTIKEMALRGQELGYEYLAVTDHSGESRIARGLDEKALINQVQEIDKLNNKIDDLTILKGLEVNIDVDGKLDINKGILEELDIVVGSVHSGFKQDFFEMTNRMVNAMENEHIHIIAHPTGRKIQEKMEYDLNLDKIMEVAHETNTFLEINAHPNRLDLRDVYVKRAIQNNFKLVINTDAHSKEQLSNMQLGISTARRGWAEKKDIINTLSLKKLLNILNK